MFADWVARSGRSLKYTVCREAKLAKRPILGEVAGSSPATATIKLETMTITEKEIMEDFRRFIRHEAMRANCSQDEIINILNIEKL